MKIFISIVILVLFTIELHSQDYDGKKEDSIFLKKIEKGMQDAYNKQNKKDTNTVYFSFRYDTSFDQLLPCTFIVMLCDMCRIIGIEGYINLSGSQVLNKKKKPLLPKYKNKKILFTIMQKKNYLPYK